MLPIAIDYTNTELPALVNAYDGASRALAMGHAGVAANQMWAAHRDAAEAELSRREFQVNADDAHEQALADPGWLSREKAWADTLEPFSTECLHNMLKHSTELVERRPACWTELQYGGACIWIERLTTLLNNR